MDWLHILATCMLWIVFVAVFFAALYALFALPFMIAGFVLGAVWSFLRLFLPFLPDFWKEPPSTGSGSGSKRDPFAYLDKTEAQKHSDLVEHIRIQNMNQERNRR